MSADPKKIQQRFEQLKTIRQPHESRWEKNAELAFPRMRGMSFSKKVNVGSRLTELLYDGTAPRQIGKLAAYWHGLMTSTSYPFFGLEMRQSELMDIKPIAAWLEECSRRQLSAFTMSNWDAMVPETNLTNILMGTSDPIFCTPRPITRVGQRFAGLRFKRLPLADCWLAENEDEIIDTLYYYYTLPAQSVVNLWPETCSHQARTQAESRPFDPVKILMSVEPRRNVIPSGYGFAKEMPFASCYIEHQSSTLLEEKGYPEFPAPTSRWSKANGEAVYGRGLFDDVAPDVFSLNELKRLKLQATALAVFPPYMRDIGFAGQVRWLPGAEHPVSGKSLGQHPPIQPIENGSRFDVAKMEEESMRADIREGLYAGLMEMPEKTMTAYEVQKYAEQIMRVLGPGVIGRDKTEKLDPIISRTFGIMLRAGAFPPPPRELLDLDEESLAIDVVYKGPLAMAQRSQETLAIDSQIERQVAVFERTQDPSMLDTIDFDEAFYHGADSSMVPSKVMRGKDQIIEIRTQRQQAAAAQAESEQRMAMADEMMKNAGAAKMAKEAGMGEEEMPA